MTQRTIILSVLVGMACSAAIIPAISSDASAQTSARNIPNKPPTQAYRSNSMRIKRADATNSSNAENGAVVIGKSNAKNTLVEYISYTCGHCAHFAAESEAPIKPYVTSGKVKVEYRSLVRDPFDFAAALLAHCGTPAQFAGNHAMLLKNQQSWMNNAKAATAEQQSKWNTEDYTANLTHIASDIGLVKLMQSRGFTPAQSNACLADVGKQGQLLSMREEAEKLGVEGTPTFFLNGKMLENNEWATVKADLDAATK